MTVVDALSAVAHRLRAQYARSIVAVWAIGQPVGLTATLRALLTAAFPQQAEAQLFGNWYLPMHQLDALPVAEASEASGAPVPWWRCVPGYYLQYGDGRIVVLDWPEGSWPQAPAEARSTKSGQP